MKNKFRKVKNKIFVNFKIMKRVNVSFFIVVITLFFINNPYLQKEFVLLIGISIPF